jgi:hypothetical protein
MLEKIISTKKFKINFFSNIVRFIYQNVQNKILRNFWNCTGTVLLVSMTFLKKVICEKTFLLINSKLWDRIIKKWRDKGKKWDWTFLDFFYSSRKNILVSHIFSLCPINGKRQIFFFQIGLWRWPLTNPWA